MGVGENIAAGGVAEGMGEEAGEEAEAEAAEPINQGKLARLEPGDCGVCVEGEFLVGAEDPGKKEAPRASKDGVSAVRLGQVADMSKVEPNRVD